jgi:hypothetical protein
VDDVPWIALIAAFVGSSGIIGGLTLAVQHSRASRLRRSIREALELADAFGDQMRPRHALTAAATMDAYRLASMSLMGLRSRAVSRMVILIVALMVALVFAGFAFDRLLSATTFGMPTWLLLTIYGAFYVVALVWMLDSTLRRRRDTLVERFMASGEFAVVYEDGRSRIVEADAVV